jgi:hypothetical protein
VDGVKGRVGYHALFEEAFEFLGGVRILVPRYTREGMKRGLAFLIRRRERLVSMTRWRSSDTIVRCCVLGNVLLGEL